jgi:hypothetical protein
MTFPHGQVTSESDMFAVGFRVEYLSGKLLALNVELWETALIVQCSSSRGLGACLVTLYGAERTLWIERGR